MHTIFIGYDQRQDAAAAVCAFSLKRFASEPLDIRFLNHRALRAAGIFTRPWLIEENGQFKDLRDGKPFSTEFSHSRFLVGALAPPDAESVLFVDNDFLFLDDVCKLFALRNEAKAIQCVKVQWEPPPEEKTKMDNMLQTSYRRKLWSSLMLWNCKHEANKKITPYIVNYIPGGDLHAFTWLQDDKLIGGLPQTWNWMEGVNADKAGGRSPQAVHFTKGGPWLGGDFLNLQYAGAWLDMYQEMLSAPSDKRSEK